MSSMASLLNTPIPFASINKNTCTWSMVPMSNRRAGSSMHGMIEPKLPRWLKGSGRVGIGTKRGDLSRVQCEDWSCGISPPHYPHSTLETINRFYSLINIKDDKGFDTLLTDDCEYNDAMFYIPIRRRQGVVDFLKQLMDAMGENIKVEIESIAEGEKYSASVNWHLEWRKHKIPYTAGNTFFQCGMVGEKLLIKTIRGMEELPWKPGDYALKLLKNVSIFFDRFPGPAELLLRSEGKQEGLIVTILHLLGNADHGSS